MTVTVDALINGVLEREGGYVDHPADRGGPTKYGITQGTLTLWRGEEQTRDDVRGLTRAEAEAIYRARYYRDPKIDMLPECLQAPVLDMAVNHGPSGAVKMLQEVLQGYEADIAVDGRIGPHTTRVARLAVAQFVGNKLVDRRRRFYRDIVDRDPTQHVFLTGWQTRAEGFRVT